VSGHLGLLEGFLLDEELLLGRIGDGHEAGVHTEAWLSCLGGDVIVRSAGVPYTSLC
jgi:hypothetical protein